MMNSQAGLARQSENLAMIIFSAIPVVGREVYPRPKREGVKPSPTIAETMIMAENLKPAQIFTGRNPAVDLISIVFL